MLLKSDLAKPDNITYHEQNLKPILVLYIYLKIQKKSKGQTPQNGSALLKNDIPNFSGP